MQIGFIGQGWIGKHYADDFERRGYRVVRYALEAPYNVNKDAIGVCDIVFIAVPTPTTPEGFDDTALRAVVSLVGKGKIAVVKSTLVPGTTTSIQHDHPDIIVMHSPEFLTEKTAAYDAAHPMRNLIGIVNDTPAHHAAAQAVLSVLPDAPYTKVMAAREAELVKYAGNCFLFTKVIFMNMLYDLAQALGADWELVRDALVHDPRIGESHTRPVDASGHSDTAGRGAGGHCLIKDFESFRVLYDTLVSDTEGRAVLQALIDKNVDLLVKSGKDIELLTGVYGPIQS